MMNKAEMRIMFDQVALYFIDKYGNDRALWICRKLFPAAYNEYTVEETIRLGEKIHTFNTILSKTGEK